jgi:putative serine protease PepD
MPGYHPTAHAAQPLEGTVLPSSEQPQPPYVQPPVEQPQPQGGYWFSAEQPPVGPPVPPHTPPAGQPPVPPADGFGAPPTGDDATPPRRRMRKPLTLVAAVAVLSALAGGVAGGLISEKTSDHASYATNAVVTGDKSSTSNTAAIAKAVSPAVVQIEVTNGNSQDIGTGIVLTADGQILTNFHVIADATDNSGGTIKITFSDGKTATGSIVGTDASLDVAVIKAQGVSGLKTASLGDSSQVAVGDQVVAIGNPDGLTGTVTSGIVSALNRPVKVDVSPTTTQSNGGFGLPFWQGDNGRSDQPSSGQTASYNAIQTDASLNPGNSGGPLLNSSGQVVGINASMYSSSGSSSSGSQAGSVGLGFAIPINSGKAVLPQLQSGQSITS